MKLAQNILTLRKLLDKEDQAIIGFVPTMGALHAGHISLVEKSISECDRTVVSIFVNPTQFNDRNDLDRYPRNLDRDLQMLDKVLGNNDIVFTPEYEDLYHDEKSFNLDLEGLDKLMEGKYRQGHFEGVVRVVKLLFEAVKPGKAYFGQKDFQQLTIIKTMVRKLGMEAEIISCPILREPNGLAMSSRNERLSPELRSKASIIYRSLSENCKLDSPSQLSDVEKTITDTINSTPGITIEYFDVVDNVTLKKITPKSVLLPDRQYFGCIAVYAGEIRLIDNIEFSFQLLKG